MTPKEQTERIINTIKEATEPATITHNMVGTVLDHMFNQITPVCEVESEDAMDAMIEAGTVDPTVMYFVPEE